MRLSVACWLLSIAAILSVACAVTTTRSQVNPQLAGHRYGRVLVCLDFADLSLRQDGELAFERILPTHFVAGHRLFFPGMTSDEVGRILRDQHVEAVLIVHPAESGRTETWVPPTTTTTGSVTVIGNYAYGSATTQTSGGYTLEKPWANFAAQLVEVPSARVVWVSAAYSRGNAFARSQNLVKSMAGKMVKQLQQDRILGTNESDVERTRGALQTHTVRRGPAIHNGSSPQSAAPSSGSSRLRLISEPTGAEVSALGARLGITTSQGLLLDLPVGHVLVQVKKVGYVPVEKEIDLEAGTDTVLQVRLEPDTKKP